MKRTAAIIGALGCLAVTGGYAIGRGEDRAARDLSVKTAGIVADRRADLIRDCRRDVADRRDAQAIDRDLERFVRAAAKFRRRSREPDAAKLYERIAARVRRRAANRRGRLVACGDLYRVVLP